MSGSSPSVINHQLLHVSASQVTTFRRCQRKWWLEKVQRLSTGAGTGAQNLGTKIHAQMEEWQEADGHPLPEHPGARFAAEKLEREDGASALPRPGTPGVLVETPLEMPEIFVEGVRYKGYIDLVWTTQGGQRVEIVDYKSTKSYSYAKTKEQLRADVQLGSYGFWARKAYPQATSMRLSHVYILSRGKSARVVEVEVSWDDVDQVWKSIGESVREMKRVVQVRAMADVEDNTDACGDWSGCPFYGICRPLEEILSGNGDCEPDEPIDDMPESVA